LVVNRAVFRVPPESSGGGAEKHGYNLANSLAELGHQVHFVTKTRPGAWYHYRVKVHSVPPNRAVIPPKTSFGGWVLKHLFGTLLSLTVALRVLAKERFRFDIIHSHGAMNALLLSILVGRKIPVVYTMHDPSPWLAFYSGRFERLARKGAYVCSNVPCLRRVDMVLSVSPALEKEALRWKARRSRLRYIPNGVDLDVSQTRGEVRRKDVEEPLGLFVGQLVRRKGVHVLLDAIGKTRNGNTRFLIVGDGPEKEKLMKQSKTNGISQRVYFAGYVGQEELDKYYGQASFFVYPSLAESFGFALFDAIARGLPTVASDLSVYDGILRSRENSLLFEPGNAGELAYLLDELVEKSDLRKTLSDNGRTLVKKYFNWPEVASRVAEAYLEVVSKRQRIPKDLSPRQQPEDPQETLSWIATRIAAVIPAQSIYLVGSRAQHLEYGKDYDIIVVMKNGLVPVYLNKLNRLSGELSHEIGCRVNVSPLPTFRLRRASGNLFLMKNGRAAILLSGRHLMEMMETGSPDEVVLDWYFSYYCFLLKELLAAYDPGHPKDVEPIVKKIYDGLSYISMTGVPRISGIASDYTRKIEGITLDDIAWFRLRDLMLALFGDLVSCTLRPGPTDLASQVDNLVERSKGKSVVKNFEYWILLLLKGEIVRPDRVFSRKLILDRYRGALIFLAAAVSLDGTDRWLTSKAYQMLQGCLNLRKVQGHGGNWESLFSAMSNDWDRAQSLMGL